jgi:rhodanese-related sulfurtransferase
MASMLYDSLHEKLLRLDDRVEVYPAHGAGSMCGRNISKETSSTIGQQRRHNYALAPMPRDEFVRMMTADLSPAPAYFSRDAELNRAGAPPLEALARPAALAPEEVAGLAQQGHVILDTRAAAEFGAGHVPGALNVGLGGQFAMWAGSLVAHDAPVVLVAADEQTVDEALTRLARVGIESVHGYLRGGMRAWREAGLETSQLPQISVEELHRLFQEQPRLQILDVRRPGEYAAGHVPGAHSAPLDAFRQNPPDALDPARPVAVICAGGYRSSAAASILARTGFRQLLNVTGGTSAYVNAGYPVEK